MTPPRSPNDDAAARRAGGLPLPIVGHVPLAPVPARVVSTWRETGDVFSFELEPPAGYSFLPGQFNMLWAFGVGESAISVSGDPGDHARIVHTIREVGSVTRALSLLRPGDEVGLRGPFGRSWPLELPTSESPSEQGPARDPAELDLVLVAGGLGLAPLRPCLYHALSHRERYRRVVVLVGARGAAELPFASELAALERRSDLELAITVDRADASWRGHVGVVTSLFPRARIDPARSLALVCGPEVMMRFAARDLARLGLSEERIFVSMERNMKCAVGFCGHCQWGASFVCKDGPVFRYDQVASLLTVREL